MHLSLYHNKNNDEKRVMQIGNSSWAEAFSLRRRRRLLFLAFLRALAIEIETI